MLFWLIISLNVNFHDTRLGSQGRNRRSDNPKNNKNVAKSLENNKNVATSVINK
jgi:hypothetical protein